MSAPWALQLGPRNLANSIRMMLGDYKKCIVLSCNGSCSYSFMCLIWTAENLHLVEARMITKIIPRAGNSSGETCNMETGGNMENWQLQKQLEKQESECAARGCDGSHAVLACLWKMSTHTCPPQPGHLAVLGWAPAELRHEHILLRKGEGLPGTLL